VFASISPGVPTVPGVLGFAHWSRPSNSLLSISIKLLEHLELGTLVRNEWKLPARVKCLFLVPTFFLGTSGQVERQLVSAQLLLRQAAKQPFREVVLGSWN
jgi:hypothetical protein